jgi:hypothetical protein
MFWLKKAKTHETNEMVTKNLSSIPDFMVGRSYP